MPSKLAITVAGAVSLGAYEAGVLYEIIDAIAQHNQHPATKPEERVIVDVLTGASAGGISATVLAQKLLFEADALSGPYTNTLYRAWVQDLQFEPLMALQSDEDPSHSILSSDLVDTLSRKYLTQRYSTHISPVSSPHPAAADRIQLGLALANLNGIDYQYPQRPEGTFTYTRFQDQMQATIEPTSDTVDFWEPLRKAAVSCSAFPFAFRVHDLARHKSEYDSPNIVFPLPIETFTYTDGGTFENQPIGLAKNLVDILDPVHADTASRFYLFISPHAKSSDSNSKFNETNADFLALLTRIVPSIFGQAGFQDWIRAEEINERIRLFNGRAEGLKTAIQNGLAPASLQAAANELLPLLFANRAPGEETLDDARTRLRIQFGVEYAELSTALGSATANTWIDSILTLESAADLGDRDEMIIYGITADSSELAGAALQAFLGFFKQDYRDHDYDVGRTKAQAFLTSLQQAGPGQSGGLPPLNYTPKPIRQIDHDLDGLTLEKVPSNLRQNMMDRLEDRASDLLQEAGINAVERETVKLFLIRPQLKKLLNL